MHKKIFGASIKHVGGLEPWSVEVLDARRKAIETRQFKTQEEANRFINSVMQ